MKSKFDNYPPQPQNSDRDIERTFPFRSLPKPALRLVFVILLTMAAVAGLLIYLSNQ